MAVNTEEVGVIPAYNPPQEEKVFLQKVIQRIQELKRYRTTLRANAYDTSSKARSLEETWDFCDYIALPHKYSHPEMRDWMASNSRPVVFSKIQTALSILVSKIAILLSKDEIPGITSLFNTSKMLSMSWVFTIIVSSLPLDFDVATMSLILHLWEIYKTIIIHF